jgi:tryptophan 2,3-dioxygenase
MTNELDPILSLLKEKYAHLEQDPKTYLNGLLHAKPVNYWDYVEVDTLLSLQKPRTDFKDEFIFIVYHQITELVLRLIRHELEQLTTNELPDVSIFIEKAGRIERYTDLLINSFSIMNKGMSYEQYTQFRLSLAPASGFQSAQFRLIEIYFSDIDSLINEMGKKRMPADCRLEEKFQYVYWQDAGYDRNTGKKSLTLKQFEEKYLPLFSEYAHKMKDHNLYRQFLKLQSTGADCSELIKALRALDKKFNVSWPMVHLETAHTYLTQRGEKVAATGGSAWTKYLHPKYQRRIFFPSLWSDDEKNTWGEEA